MTDSNARDLAQYTDPEQVKESLKDSTVALFRSKLACTVADLNEHKACTIILSRDGVAYSKNFAEIPGNERWYPAWTVGNNYEQDFGVTADKVPLPAYVLLYYPAADEAEH